MKVVVGSKNPVKVGAVAEAFGKYWPESEVVGIEVVSGVGEQPMSEQETMIGARQRARAAFEVDPKADYGVGLEGGVTEIESKMFECAWACVVKRGGKPADAEAIADKEGSAGGLYFELPRKISEKIRAGGELGPIIDEMTGEKNVKQKGGAIGMFSKGRLDRRQAYVQIVLSALIKFVSPEWFFD